jgi:BASS family bile acid:Na+ symporter
MKLNLQKPISYLFLLFILSVVTVIGLRVSHHDPLIPPLLVLAFCSLALFFMAHPILKSFAFTAWVLAVVVLSLSFPAAFATWFGLDLKYLIVPLIQIIMFGMGTTLNLADFKRVLKMPIPVFIGIFLQYSIMPFVGYGIAMSFGFEPEVAAGIILIGACPGGVASNVMSYLGKGDVALSVTMTAVSTMVSPVMTPFYMQLLAGKLVPIHFIAMMLSIFDMIIVPIVAGFIANKILYSTERRYNEKFFLSVLAMVAIAAGAGLIVFGSHLPSFIYTMRNGLVIGCLLIGVVAIAKWIVNALHKQSDQMMNKALPLVSMSGICFIIAIITARSSADLMRVGSVLIIAVMLHNLIGYLLAYWLAKAFRLGERACRTIAFEVGLQNGGMATGLAMNVLHSVKSALAAAIFGPWQNVSGSILANYWQRKKTNDHNDSIS